MANFFKKLARVLAVVLAVIAIVMLVISCLAFAGVSTTFLPSIIAGLEPMGYLILAAACAVVAVMLSPEAAMKIISKAFDSAGRIITVGFEKIVEVGTAVGEAATSAFFSSPLGMAVIGLAGFFVYKSVSKPEPKPEPRYQEVHV